MSPARIEQPGSPSGARTRRLILGTCCGVHLVQDGLIATMYVVLPILAQAFGLGYAEAGAIRALHTSAMSVLEIPSGILADRVGERILLVFGLTMAGIGYLCLSRSSELVGVTLSLFVAGIGAAFQHALSSSVISKTFLGTAPRSALGTYNSAGDVGKLAFTGVFSLALGLGALWQEVISGFGAMTLLAAAWTFIVLGRLASGTPAETAPGERASRSGWGILDPVAFRALVLIVFLDISVQSGFLTFLAFLMLEKQVPAGLASMAVVLTLAGGILGKFGCGLMADRLGVRLSLVVVEIVCAIAIIAVALAPTLVAFCLLPLLGVVLQGSSSITYGTVADLVSPERHARAFALIYSVSGLAAIAAPILFGTVGDVFGLVPAMLCMAFTVLLPVPLSRRLWPSRPIRSGLSA